MLPHKVTATLLHGRCLLNRTQEPVHLEGFVPICLLKWLNDTVWPGDPVVIWSVAKAVLWVEWLSGILGFLFVKDDKRKVLVFPLLIIGQPLDDATWVRCGLSENCGRNLSVVMSHVKVHQILPHFPWLHNNIWTSMVPFFLSLLPDAFAELTNVVWRATSALCNPTSPPSPKRKGL